jgi:hypothetical protein
MSNEIPLYGGVFRGRTITFDITSTAPIKHGSYLTHWSTRQEGFGPLGDELAVPIMVAPEPTTIAMLATGLLALHFLFLRREAARLLIV